MYNHKICEISWEFWWYMYHETVDLTQKGSVKMSYQLILIQNICCCKDFGIFDLLVIYWLKSCVYLFPISFDWFICIIHLVDINKTTAFVPFADDKSVWFSDTSALNPCYMLALWIWWQSAVLKYSSTHHNNVCTLLQYVWYDKTYKYKVLWCLIILWMFVEDLQDSLWCLYQEMAMFHKLYSMVKDLRST